MARVRDHDTGRAAKPGPVADEDHLRAGRDEPVDEVLREIGYSAAEIESFRGRKVI